MMAARDSSRARAAAWTLVLAAAVVSGGCKRKHVPVDAVPDLGYPTCAGAEDAGAGALLARRTLRAGADSMAESGAVESFELRRRACHLVTTAHQEWKLGATDIEVVFDDKLLPLRAWKRMTSPGTRPGEAHVDVRRYELRTPEVTIAKRSGDSPVTFEILRGTRPTAVIGPGRGLFSAWIRRANLAVGEKVREPVLDFRELVEILRDVTLKREPDLFEPTLQRNVRVYTVYGRDAIYTDEDNVVIGDLAGLRAVDPEPNDASASSAIGVPDPVHTP